MKTLSLILALTLSGCATTQTPVINSAHALLAVRDEYKATGEAMFRGCSTGKIPSNVCLSWAKFTDRFVPAYELAVTAWGVGAGAAGSAGPDWPSLVVELGAFTASLVALAFAPPPEVSP